MRFVSLHSHTSFSYGDGYRVPEVHVKRVKELGMTALGLTEHGNVSSHAQLEKAAVKHGIKPIFGCELYIAPTDRSAENGILKTRKKFHQTVLAKDAEGYHSLMHMVSDSWKYGYFQWPTTSAKTLKKYREGLVVFSGCSDSLLSCTLLGGKTLGEKLDPALLTEVPQENFDRARIVIEKYQEMFGEDYYLEVQRFPELERTCLLNPALAELSQITGAQLIATADVHYPYPHQNKMQAILHASHRGGTVDSVEASWEYSVLLTYPTSDEEIYRDLVGTGLGGQQGGEAWTAIENTALVAERCCVELPKNEPIKFPYPSSGLLGEKRTRAYRVEMKRRGSWGHGYGSIEDYVWGQLRQGWRFRGLKVLDDEKQKKYLERLRDEMHQITDKNFLDYFAMVSDSVQWAKDRKIPVGPARGSAAASLVCWLLRITEIDPMKQPHMMFSRFIDPNRLDLPDIDLDFSDDRRHEVVEYLISVYGDDRVGKIGNFVRYKGKNSIDDVARVYEVPKWAANVVKDLIVERSGGDARQSESLADTFEMFPRAKEMLEEFPDLGRARDLEGDYRGMSIHAAGIVISNAPIADTCALYTRPKKPAAEEFDLKDESDFVTVIAYDKIDVEYVGMLKMDYLGLKTMGLIGIALDYIGMDLEDLYRVPITESKVLRAFASNDLVGIFQYEGRATAIVNRDVYPENFGHLVDINALSRPGPLFSGMTADYCSVKHGKEERQKLHPIVDEITEWTYGQIVYQEQVLRILSELAGFPAIRVGDIRRIISKKSGMQVMEQAYEEFRQGCSDLHGIDADLSRKIWDYIATSSTYSFNISHSTSYAMLGLWCMWLKVYHPKEFYAAALAKVGDGKNVIWRRGRLIRDAQAHGINVAPPDLLRSDKTWSIKRTLFPDSKDQTILGGFSQIAGIGPVNTKKILEWRNDILTNYDPDHPGESIDPRHLYWDDLRAVSGIGPKKIEMIKEFVASDDPYQTQWVKIVLDGARRSLREMTRSGDLGFPLPTHHSTTIPQTGFHEVVWMGMARNLNYKDVVEATRARTGKDEAEILADLKDPELRRSCVIQAYDEGEEDVYLRINRWRFPQMEEDLQEIKKDEDVILVVGKKREDFGISIHVSDMLVLKMEEEE